jgi:hypothetical protein
MRSVAQPVNVMRMSGPALLDEALNVRREPPDEVTSKAVGRLQSLSDRPPGVSGATHGDKPMAARYFWGS